MDETSWEQRFRMMFARRFIEPRLTAECRDIAEASQEQLHTVADALCTHYGAASPGESRTNPHHEV